MTYYWHRREFRHGLAAFSTACQGDAVFVGDERRRQKATVYPAGVTIAGHGDMEVRPAKLPQLRFGARLDH
jgi:hypothetical protein